MNALDVEISQSPVYLHKVDSSSKGGGASGGGINIAEEIAMQESMGGSLDMSMT